MRAIPRSSKPIIINTDFEAIRDLNLRYLPTTASVEFGQVLFVKNDSGLQFIKVPHKTQTVLYVSAGFHFPRKAEKKTHLLLEEDMFVTSRLVRSLSAIGVVDLDLATQFLTRADERIQAEQTKSDVQKISDLAMEIKEQLYKNKKLPSSKTGVFLTVFMDGTVVYSSPEEKKPLKDKKSISGVK